MFLLPPSPKTFLFSLLYQDIYIFSSSLFTVSETLFVSLTDSLVLYVSLFSPLGWRWQRFLSLARLVKGEVHPLWLVVLIVWGTPTISDVVGALVSNFNDNHEVCSSFDLPMGWLCRFSVDVGIWGRKPNTPFCVFFSLFLISIVGWRMIEWVFCVDINIQSSKYLLADLLISVEFRDLLWVSIWWLGEIFCKWWNFGENRKPLEHFRNLLATFLSFRCISLAFALL